MGDETGSIIVTSNSGDLWEMQSNIFTKPIIKIYFLDQDTGWALTENSFRQTMDGGTSWIDIEGITSPEYLIDFVVPSSDEIWLLSSGFLLRTLNGGVTFDTTTIALIVIGTFSYSYNSLIAWNDATAEISGINCHYNGALDISTCNGFGYQPVLGSYWPNEIELLYSTGFEHGINSSQIVKENLGWIVGDSGLIAMTDSAGYNWNVQESGTFNNLFALSFIDTLTGWVLGKNNLILHTTDGGENWSTLVSIDNQEYNIPNEFTLLQNYPNPFNPVTTIEYSLPKASEVLVTVYNVLGEEVTRLVENTQLAGHHRVIWNASKVASGIYFYRLQAGEFVQTRKMIYLK